MIALHSYLRWLILALFIVVLVRHLFGIIQKKQFEPLDKTLSLILTISLDTMLLIGIVVYFMSPFGYGIFAEMGALVMKEAALRKIAVEHPLQMVLAIVFAHIGAAQRKKDILDSTKHKKMFVLYLISFVLILSGIPWNR